MKKINFFVSLTLLVFVFCGITSIIEPFAEKQSPIDEQQDYPSKIAFVRYMGWGIGYEIFIMNPDGSDQIMLTTNYGGGSDGSLSWSPDGSKIVYEGEGGIWVMNSDGSNQIRLTNNIGYGVNPSWSPDGSKIAFSSDTDGDCNAEIYLINEDGSNKNMIADNSYRVFNHSSISWSPDGSKIVCAAIGIHVINADGTNPINLTPNDKYAIDPSWSPDVSKIAFLSGRDGVRDSPYVIYVMNSDGTNQTRLTAADGDSCPSYSPSWSPDGTKIVYRSMTRYWNEEYMEFLPLSGIFVMNADGSNKIRLTDKTDYSPSWSWIIK